MECVCVACSRSKGIGIERKETGPEVIQCRLLPSAYCLISGLIRGCHWCIQAQIHLEG